MLFCQACYQCTTGRKVTPGSFATELVLWILMFPVGFIYSIWRYTNRTRVCSTCSSPAVLPANSERAVFLMNQMRAQQHMIAQQMVHAAAWAGHPQAQQVPYGHAQHGGGHY